MTFNSCAIFLDHPAYISSPGPTCEYCVLVRSSGFIYTGDLYLSPDTENLDPFCFVLVSDIRLCLASMCATEPKCEINYILYFTIIMNSVIPNNCLQKLNMKRQDNKTLYKSNTCILVSNPLF